MQAEALKPSSETFSVARSFSGKRWILRACADDDARALERAGNISPFLARLLAGRGVRAEELPGILNPTIKQLLPDPSTLKDMDKAVARAREALDRHEKIAVFGDYDVDGSCSSALMSEFLTALGRPPRIYIPDRMTEGYGPNAPAFLKLKEEGASIVFTVDCGAVATGPLTAARDAGLDVIVLDHHTVDVAPPSFAQVNPNQPGDASGLGYVCAAGVTFLFLVALNRGLRESGWYEANSIAEPDLRDYLDLVALATICDVVPLVGINRAIVRAGLAKLSVMTRPGIKALADVAKVTAPVTTYHLGFGFGPRINAGGRVGSCSLGVELLTAKEVATAEELAMQLDLHNKERQALEKLILEEAMALAGTQSNAPVILVHGEGWHHGVVGIVAGRLKDRFSKPALVAGFEGGMGRGSARSIPGVDIGAIMRAAHENGLLETGGGHAMAAGFSLREAKLDAFREFLHARDITAPLDAAIELSLDVAISPAGATREFVEHVERMGPFGAGNPEPFVLVPDARVVFADVVGKDHVRLRLQGGDGTRLDAIAFRVAGQPLGKALLAARGRPIHAAGRLKKDGWNGQIRVQLHLEDAAPAGG
jgi:single-stranded-DNA-specific exonuclease